MPSTRRTRSIRALQAAAGIPYAEAARQHDRHEGRSREALAELTVEGALTQAQAQTLVVALVQGRCILITGWASTGKTRLAAALTAGLAPVGRLTAITCSPQEYRHAVAHPNWTSWQPPASALAAVETADLIRAAARMPGATAAVLIDEVRTAGDARAVAALAAPWIAVGSSAATATRLLAGEQPRGLDAGEPPLLPGSAADLIVECQVHRLPGAGGWRVAQLRRRSAAC